MLGIDAHGQPLRLLLRGEVIRFIYVFQMEALGVEPRTSRTLGTRSATELSLPPLLVLSTRMELHQTCSLAICFFPLNMPPTHCFCLKELNLTKKQVLLWAPGGVGRTSPTPPPAMDLQGVPSCLHYTC